MQEKFFLKVELILSAGIAAVSRANLLICGADIADMMYYMRQYRGCAGILGIVGGRHSHNNP